MTLFLRCAARSHVGLVRQRNEDSGYAGTRLAVIADGMGGHAAGDVASRAAVRAVAELEEFADADPVEALTDALEQANTRLRELIEADREKSGMGTTMTALLSTERGVALAHVGDSRAYLFRDGVLTQLTHDHTYVQSLVDAGRLKPEDVGTHPQRSLILRALDGRGSAEPDVGTLDLRSGDRLVLCSDGLSAVVGAEALGEALAAGPDPAGAAERLVDLALQGGAPDNVTVVVADVVDSGDTMPQPGPAAGLVGAAAAGDPATPARSRLLHRQAPATDGMHDEEYHRYAPRPPRRFRWLIRLAWTALALAIVAGVAWGAHAWSRGQYYVGAEDGHVVIFRGLDQRIGGLDLSEVFERPGGLPVGALPDFYQGQVAGSIPADGPADARRIVGELRTRACDEHPPAASPTPSPTPDPTLTSTPAPSPTAAPTVTSTPAPTVTPGPAPTPGYPGLTCPGTSR